jgi:molybdopterin-binding protein
MWLSSRNILKGKIVEVVRGQVTTEDHIDIAGSVITSSLMAPFCSASRSAQKPHR